MHGSRIDLHMARPSFPSRLQDISNNSSWLCIDRIPPSLTWTDPSGYTLADQTMFFADTWLTVIGTSRMSSILSPHLCTRSLQIFLQVFMLCNLQLREALLAAATPADNLHLKPPQRRRDVQKNNHSSQQQRTDPALYFTSNVPLESSAN